MMLDDESREALMNVLDFVEDEKKSFEKELDMMEEWFAHHSKICQDWECGEEFRSRRRRILGEIVVSGILAHVKKAIVSATA